MQCKGLINGQFHGMREQLTIALYMSKCIKMNEVHSRIHEGEEISANLEPYKEIPVVSVSGKLFEAFVKREKLDEKPTFIHFCVLRYLLKHTLDLCIVGTFLHYSIHAAHCLMPHAERDW